eukprot:COSAG01_NODE_71207_length_256_cov_1.312102_1_plen_60_part_01
MLFSGQRRTLRYFADESTFQEAVRQSTAGSALKSKAEMDMEGAIANFNDEQAWSGSSYVP